MSGVTVACWAGRTFEFDPKKTALIVIDMQRHFLTEFEVDSDADGAADASQAGTVEATDATEEAAGEPMDTREIIPRVSRLLSVGRELGLLIVHTREGYGADMSDVSEFRRSLDYVGYESSLGRTLIRGEPGHDFVEELTPLPGEPVIDKASFGAFYETGLHQLLTARGVTHLILCGVTTQCCVHSTLREAVDHGYWCLTVADCCAASDQALHDAALLLIMGEGHLFGWIADIKEVEVAAGQETPTLV